jgi:hypothetical protein
MTMASWIPLISAALAFLAVAILVIFCIKLGYRMGLEAADLKDTTSLPWPRRDKAPAAEFEPVPGNVFDDAMELEDDDERLETLR